MTESRFLNVVKKLPRVTLDNLKPNPGAVKRPANRRGHGNKGMYSQRPKRTMGQNLYNHFHERMPHYGFNRNEELKRQYLPLTLWNLQRLIDLGRINPDEPVDIAALANCRGLNFNTKDTNYYGIYLLEQGANIFQTRVNIEVQVANELAIATVEKQGGVITNTFFDRMSYLALTNPVKYFLKGDPIQKRLLPPEELVTYYTDPKVRGYLSDPAEVVKERQALADKYGYTLPDITKDSKFDMLMERKDPRQIFYGLSPGWIVNLADESVLKPDSDLYEEWAKM
uniref:Large ribosomal subunit protein uL15m n=1 Tax=Phallusia mammillata TaxID=59560 RepID=A0A6F9DLE5_9ASCI|nr:39S ribosomal protein L15, mitochondrial-like [Phallusia mammillata]